MDEPPLRIDPRFLLANERTLLAWVRTSIALLAAAGGIFEFTDVSGRKVLAVCLAIVGIATTAGGGLRYLAVANAIRAGEQMTENRALVLLAAAVTILGLGLIVGIAAS